MIRSVSVKNAIKDTLEIFQFDQWVRFYFVTEKDDGLWISIPDEVMADIKKNHSGLFNFADLVNDATTDYQTSQDNVCSFVAARLDGQKYEASVLPKVFDDTNFKIEMYIFNLWLKMHEKYLDETYMTFNEWLEMYGEWNNLEEVKEYRTKLQETGTDPQTPSCATAQ